MNYFLYGPPLTGKSTLGQSLASNLHIPFIDLDTVIEDKAKQSIAEIFSVEGEVGFRQREMRAIEEVVQSFSQVIALGGGALLNPAARAVVEKSGKVLCLGANLETLITRTNSESAIRPLLAGDHFERLKNLLLARKEHYLSFPLQLETDSGSVSDLTWQAQIRIGAFRVGGMGQSYDIRIDSGGLSCIGSYCQERKLNGTMVVVTDDHVGLLHGDTVLKGLRDGGYEAVLFSIPPGEENKNIQTILKIWDAFI
ncbi:MAG: hypothetical protein IH586_11870, partial [Anaerolineaceae bacterium]|nr:hypothetical protein [Anaerolineaceae bacterium]